MKTLEDRIVKAFNLTEDLLNHLGEPDLSLSIPNVPSNKIGSQLWCILGSRESYLKALQNNEWKGFNCSLSKISKQSIIDLLQETSHQYFDFFTKTKTYSDFQEKTLFDLLEHEIQHHGQLIRYIYANSLHFPKSWNERYTV